MHVKTLALVLAATVLSAAAFGTAPAAGAGPRVAVLKTKNVTPANRPIRSLDRIVIHTTEGSFWGAVRWLRSPRSHGSAHYVVSQQGEIVQLASTSDVAWHAGDKHTNRRSIGIEHEAWADEKGTITDAQYEESARLVGYLVRRMGIPVDREHIIGHDEVPDPNGRGVGGAHHHTDPGPHWRWDHYLDRVRHHAESPEPPQLVAPPPPPARVGTPIRNRPKARRQAVRAAERTVRCGFRPSIHSTTIYAGQTVSGIVPWQAQACGRRLHRVDFLVDGTLLWSDTVRPFAFAPGRGWNTTGLANGWHTLTLRAHGARGHRVRKLLRVRVENEPFAVAAAGLGSGQAVTGTIALTAEANAPVERLVLLAGGEPVGRSEEAPHVFELDSTELPNGARELELRARAVDGRTAATTVPVLVANSAEEDTSAPHVDWQSLSPWQTVSGPIPWQVLPGGDVAQVEFWVDGELRWTAADAPYAFGGAGGVWDAAQETPGPHTLLVRTVGSGGVSETSKVVLVEGSPGAGAGTP